MRSVLVMCSLCLGPFAALMTTTVQAAETETPAHAIDLISLLESSAERLKKRFIVDPRVRGQVSLVNLDPKRMTYDDLQAILSVHGVVATEESGGIVRIVPDAAARQLPMPILEGASSKLGPEEIVTKRIDVGSLTATQLVPILRPLLPQYAHLVAHSETNSLLVVARHANVQMIESIIRDLRTRPIVNATEAREPPKP